MAFPETLSKRRVRSRSRATSVKRSGAAATPTCICAVNGNAPTVPITSVALTGSDVAPQEPDCVEGPTPPAFARRRFFKQIIWFWQCQTKSGRLCCDCEMVHRSQEKAYASSPLKCSCFCHRSSTELEGRVLKDRPGECRSRGAIIFHSGDDLECCLGVAP